MSLPKIEMSQSKACFFYEKLIEELNAVGWKLKTEASSDRFICWREDIPKDDWVCHDSIEEVNAFLCGVKAERTRIERLTAVNNSALTPAH